MFRKRRAEFSASARINRNTGGRCRQDYRQDYSVREATDASPAPGNRIYLFGCARSLASSYRTPCPIDCVVPKCICGLTQAAPPILCSLEASAYKTTSGSVPQECIKIHSVLKAELLDRRTLIKNRRPISAREPGHL